MSLVEVVVVAALMGLVFSGLFAAFQLTVSLIGQSKEMSGALALANERLEYVRSLPYDDVGTEGGIPSGPIPQTAERELNSIAYTERVLIEFVDAPDDGEGAEDVNGILADYKRVKVEYRWDRKGEEQSLSLISNIVPNGIETTAGGGTIRVNVFDAAVQPVSGAAVRLQNDVGTTSIDTVRYTNEAGVAMFAGAPALANYEITVTKDGYSTDGTYDVTVENPNPATPPIAVVESQVSTMNFQIDQLSSLAVTTVGTPIEDSFADAFYDASGIAAFNATEVSGDAIRLVATEGVYAGSGSARSLPVAPASLDRWDTLSFTLDAPADTTATVQLVSPDGLGGYAPVSESDLPGNAAGFASGPVDLSTLDGATYPELALMATLESANGSLTPAVLDWELAYIEAEPPIPDVPFSLVGTKQIGTAADGTPIPKHSESYVTDGNGERDITLLEWDTYEVSLETAAYDIAEACGLIPFALAPNVAGELKLTLAPAVTHSLRVAVTDAAGAVIPNATTTLSRAGTPAEAVTSACGQVFFNDSLVAAEDYELTVTAAGYQNETVTDLAVSGATAITVILSP